MSELRDVLSDVVTERQPLFGDTITNLRTGVPFTAETEEIQDLELNTELGRDARESILLHVLDPIVAADLTPGTRVEFNRRGVKSRFQIVRRKDNPVGVMTEFGCAKLVDGKDT